MDIKTILLLTAAGLALLAVAAGIFSTPLKLIMKVALNTLLGLGALILLNATSALTGLSLGLNLFNALVVGVLGVPGAGAPAAGAVGVYIMSPQNLSLAFSFRSRCASTLQILRSYVIRPLISSSTSLSWVYTAAESFCFSMWGMTSSSNSLQ